MLSSAYSFPKRLSEKSPVRAWINHAPTFHADLPQGAGFMPAHFYSLLQSGLVVAMLRAVESFALQVTAKNLP